MDPNRPADPKTVKLMCMKPSDEEIALHQAIMRMQGKFNGPEPTKRDYFIKRIRTSNAKQPKSD